MEHVVYLKSQLASQLEDSRRRLEDEERRRSLLEANLHQVSIFNTQEKRINSRIPRRKILILRG